MAGVRGPDEALEALAGAPGGDRVLAVLRAHPQAWLVGGAVRDALLGREPRELDVVVDGDPEAVLAALGGEVVERHERFGTAMVDVGGGAVVDVVRARAETYAAPGALPDVRPGSLEEDLARRDLTVNALALRPGEGGAGAVLREHPGGVDDLRAGVLRVLHDGSFADDPTRIWRTARYAARLGFAVEAHTRDLARAADVSTVSGVRLGNELRLALREPDPLAALAAARDLQPALLPAALTTEPPRLGEALALLPPEGRADLVVLAAAVAPMDAAALVAWLDAMGFTAAERDVVGAGSRASTFGPLRAARTPSEIARAARGAPVEVVALAGGDNARRWLEDLHAVRLSITGDDLLAAGVPAGPEVGRRLQQALDRKLDEGLPDRAAELRAAME